MAVAATNRTAKLSYRRHPIRNLHGDSTSVPPGSKPPTDSDSRRTNPSRARGVSTPAVQEVGLRLTKPRIAPITPSPAMASMEGSGTATRKPRISPPPKLVE